jgi:hypothetical protein
MWLLSCDGNLFEGKRLWLRPGTAHLFGRTTGKTESGERLRYIEHKSVSRKHLTIEVSAVNAGDSTRLHARSEVKITEGSKLGTLINGEKICQETRTLTEREYTIKLGNYEHLFHLWWHPVTLSFAGLSKKKDRDSLGPWREKLERADVKLALEYVTNETTHVISKKRNTPATLQALLQARWVVTDGFAEALAAAVERRAENGTSLLEHEFDGNWPKEDSYLVPSANEPNPRAPEYLKPDPSRFELFQDFVFVFTAQSQYDTLLPVITAGGGKALVREVNFESTTVQEFAEFVKAAAGHKAGAPFRLSQQTGKGGVVVVYPNQEGDEAAQFMRSLELALDQRSFPQNEFLDAILMTDAKGLRRQLEEEPASPVVDVNSRTANKRPQSKQREEPRQQRAVTVPDSPAPAEQEPPRTQPQPDEQEQAEPPSATTRRRNRRIITQSRFKGFDDVDPSQFSKPASQSPERSVNNREASVAASENNMDVDQPSQQAARTQQTSRKRPAPEESEDQEDVMDSILPGHAAMKRQKTLAGEAGNAISSSKATAPLASEKTAKPKKKSKEIDVKAEIQARRQREEEARKRDEEALQNATNDLSIEEMKKLVAVEDMDIPVREPSARARGNESGGRSERWDPAWNGRKNFKKFRPQGQRGEDAPRLHRVIVALEEVPRKGHGIGEEYWLNSATTKSRKSKSQSQSQSQSVRQGASRSQAAAADDEVDGTSFRRRNQRSSGQDHESAPMGDIIPDEIAGRPRDPEIEAIANANSTPSQTMQTESQRKTLGKRAATQAAAGAPAAKKARQTRAAARNETINVDDDDDDALKFRRRRR